jgi:phenylalanyl-tRNA synthetase beta chain
MKYSYKWLQELSGTEASVAELVELLTMHAFEVEGVEKSGLESDKIVAGEVVSLKPHPNADKLRVAQVSIGSETLVIVCGAPNIAEGQKVAVALIGSILPGGFEIKQATLRGIESQGMICSQKELGVGDDHDGIWVLPKTSEVGSLVRDITGSDSLLDIKVLPDRAHDCLSHVGMAREIAALEGRVVDFDYEGLQTKDLPLATHCAVRIDAETKTKRYIGVYLNLGKLGASPAWLQARLKTFGMRSIHPVVDATNFVMLELGQPLHAFDWGMLLGKQSKDILVRSAEAGEEIVLLDEKTYALTAEDVVIADGEKILAVAGVMGGQHSAVTSETSEIFLESACFDPVKIRRTRTRLGLRTDASDRFEKGLSPDLAERALARAVEILEHLAVDAQATHIGKVEAYPQLQPQQELMIYPETINALLGVTVEASTMKDCLQSLGFGVTAQEEALGEDAPQKTSPQDDRWMVSVPAWRLDIDGAEDLAEEVGRLLGYSVIPSQSPQVWLQVPAANPSQALTRTIEQWLVARGLSEVCNYSFYSEQDAEACGLVREKHLALANPMNPDQALMRTTMAIGLLHNVRENLKHFDDIAIFENGRVYERDTDGTVTESKQMAGAIVLHSGESAFFAAKDILDQLLLSRGIRTQWQAIETPGVLWHPTQTATVFAVLPEKQIELGTIGMVHPKVLERMNIKQKHVALWECSLEAIVEALPKTYRAQPLRKFPTSVRDIAVFVPRTVTVARIEAEARAVGGELLLAVEAFDRYEERDEHKYIIRTSLAFHLIFGADDRTLNTDEVEVATATILQSLQEKLHLKPRR